MTPSDEGPIPPEPRRLSSGSPSGRSGRVSRRWSDITVSSRVLVAATKLTYRRQDEGGCHLSGSLHFVSYRHIAPYTRLGLHALVPPSVRAVLLRLQ